jgi:hypothetical protein
MVDDKLSTFYLWIKANSSCFAKRHLVKWCISLHYYTIRPKGRLTKWVPELAKAYSAFSQGASKQVISDRSRSQTLIHQAEVALISGDFREFSKCLEQGVHIAIQIDSEKRKHEARTVLHKAPDAWKKEQKYQELAKMF